MMLKLRDLPIRYKLHLAIIGTSSAAMLLAGAAIATVQWSLAGQWLRQDLNTLAQLMATNSAATILFNDDYAAEQMLASLSARPNLQIACLFTESQGSMVTFASYASPDSVLSCHPLMLRSKADYGHLRGMSDVLFENELLGQLIIVESDASLWTAFKRYLAWLSLIMGSCLAIALVLSSWLQRLVSVPVIKLAEITSRISSSGDFSLRAVEPGKDEIGRLIRSFNSMLDKIETAEVQLRQLNLDLAGQVKERNRANLVLQDTLDRLRDAQDQLVQTEKMASLGGLVAGVAHEINTPVGIGVTAASTLLARVHELRQAYREETLTEGGLNDFMELAEQSGEIIAKNLERAANLIQSFKQVAVDQSTLDHRRFNVFDYINEILLSLRPKLKNTRITVDLDCPRDFNIDSYPGLLSQILTNLIMNSLTHAYGPEDEGQISIRVRHADKGMKLDFSDDGCGMSEDHLKQIFDPFFTTRRGEGGSGLGLHIIFNLITQQLGGKISVKSQLGLGTRFYLEIQEIDPEGANELAQAS